jgi:hypothetical protein
MKIRRNIFLNILLLTIVFFCSGIDAYSFSDAQRNYPEIPADIQNIETRLTPDTDSSDEDQMDQYHIFGLTEQPECQKSFLYTFPLPDNLFFSIWQPPKVFREKL